MRGNLASWSWVGPRLFVKPGRPVEPAEPDETIQPAASTVSGTALPNRLAPQGEGAPDSTPRPAPVRQLLEQRPKARCGRSPDAAEAPVRPNPISRRRRLSDAGVRERPGALDLVRAGTPLPPISHLPLRRTPHQPSGRYRPGSGRPAPAARPAASRSQPPAAGPALCTPRRRPPRRHVDAPPQARTLWPSISGGTRPHPHQRRARRCPNAGPKAGPGAGPDPSPRPPRQRPIRSVSPGAP